MQLLRSLFCTIPVLSLCLFCYFSAAKGDANGQLAAPRAIEVIEPAPMEDARWRELGKDEPMERGSHVRINLATGERHVKIGQERTPETRVDIMERVLYGLPTPQEGLPSEDAKQKMTKEEYEEALQKVWDHRQKEVKRAMEAMDNHTSIIRTHTTVLANADFETVSDELLQTMQVLEELVQDIDNAKNFATLKGFELCAQLLQHSSHDVRTHASFVVGSAVKGMEDLQSQALEANLVNLLVAQLKNASTAGPSPDSHQARETAKSLYALSAMLSGHEASQQIAKNGGISEVLLNILRTEEAVDDRVLSKTLNIISDFSSLGMDSKSLTSALNRHVNHPNPIIARQVSVCQGTTDNDEI